MRLRVPAMGLMGVYGQVAVDAVDANDMMPVNGNGGSPFSRGFYLSMDQHGQSRKNEATAPHMASIICYKFAITVLLLPCLIIVLGRSEK